MTSFDDRRAQEALSRLAASMLDLRSFWPLVIPIFIGWMREQFETEGDFFGDPWAPLSPRYAAWKEQHYPGKGILIAEGDLRRAASSPRRTVGPLFLELEIVDPKVRFHQEGTSKMPARPLVPEGVLPAAQQAELDSAFEVYVDERLKASGL
jgi:hypothetical protein